MKTLFTFLFLFAFAIVQAEPTVQEGPTSIETALAGLSVILLGASVLGWFMFSMKASKLTTTEKAYKVSLTQLELAREDLGNTKALLEDTKLGLRDQTKALDASTAVRKTLEEDIKVVNSRLDEMGTALKSSDLEIMRLKSSEGGLKESLRICSEDLVRVQGELEALQTAHAKMLEVAIAVKEDTSADIAPAETPAKTKASGRTRSARKNK